MSKKSKRKLSQASKNYNELRAITKELLKRKIEPDESEQLFEDDPRAVNEIEYGRVIRKPTQIFSRNIIDDL
tara:strand:- start:916 stop:1131 length:216 start_codon:yes stop_codon:yes gene_type:complete